MDTGMLAVWHSRFPPFTSANLNAMQLLLCIKQAIEQDFTLKKGIKVIKTKMH